MITFTPDGSPLPFSVPCQHGPAHGLLHGEMALLPESSGIVVLAHAAQSLDERERLLAGILRHAGLSTLTINLLARQEEHFSDVHNNVPLLARRLAEILGLLTTRMLMGELRSQPIGLCAANASSPVAVRVAALRDHDIAAIVCRGGLIDLAGALYLRTLEAPLLMLAEEHDTAHIANARRALREIPAPNELRLIPEIGLDYATSPGLEATARETTHWFIDHFTRPRTLRNGTRR